MQWTRAFTCDDASSNRFKVLCSIHVKFTDWRRFVDSGISEASRRSGLEMGKMLNSTIGIKINTMNIVDLLVTIMSIKNIKIDLLMEEMRRTNKSILLIEDNLVTLRREKSMLIHFLIINESKQKKIIQWDK